VSKISNFIQKNTNICLLYSFTLSQRLFDVFTASFSKLAHTIYGECLRGKGKYGVLCR